MTRPFSPSFFCFIFFQVRIFFVFLTFLIYFLNPDEET